MSSSNEAGRRGRAALFLAGAVALAVAGTWMALREPSGRAIGVDFVTAGAPEDDTAAEKTGPEGGWSFGVAPSAHCPTLAEMGVDLGLCHELLDHPELLAAPDPQTGSIQPLATPWAIFRLAAPAEVAVQMAVAERKAVRPDCHNLLGVIDEPRASADAARGAYRDAQRSFDAALATLATSLGTKGEARARATAQQRREDVIARFLELMPLERAAVHEERIHDACLAALLAAAPPRCSTRTPTTDEVAAVERMMPALPESTETEAPLALKGTAEAGGVVIPVHFHVVHDGVEGNVPDAVLKEQVQVLNAAFAPGGAVQFALTSIQRWENPSWFTMTPGSAAEKEAKAATRQGGAEALNIYTARPAGGLLGWATFPWSYNLATKDDGVVLLYGTLPGGSEEPFNLGDTATHEVGHWLGLYHTFQSGCRKKGPWEGGTPPSQRPGGGCQPQDTCPGGYSDPIENFMDYTDDTCMSEFTSGQRERSTSQWNRYRAGK